MGDEPLFLRRDAKLGFRIVVQPLAGAVENLIGRLGRRADQEDVSESIFVLGVELGESASVAALPKRARACHAPSVSAASRAAVPSLIRGRRGERLTPIVRRQLGLYVVRRGEELSEVIEQRPAATPRATSPPAAREQLVARPAIRAEG